MLINIIFYLFLLVNVKSYCINKCNFILNNKKYIGYKSKIKMTNNDMSNDDNEFPSFNDFIEKRRQNEIEEQIEYEKLFDYYFKKRKYKNLNKNSKKVDKERYKNIKPTCKDIEMLNQDITLNWCDIFITVMVSLDKNFPQILYQDIFEMRDFCDNNKDSDYIFYIGYFPSNKNCRDGPYFIASVKLYPEERCMKVTNIIQNPNYIDIEDDVNNILNFKHELMALANDSCIFFKFNNLKNSTNKSYYYSWLYEM